MVVARGNVDNCGRRGKTKVSKWKLKTAWKASCLMVGAILGVIRKEANLVRVVSVNEENKVRKSNSK